jgi:hypothetical protein
LGTTVATRSPDAGTRALPLRLDLSGDPLADLDEVAAGVAHVAAQLVTPFCGRCQELGPAGAPLLVDGVDVGDADVEETADVIGVRGVSSVTVGWSSAGGPPTLMTIQLFASAMTDGTSPSSTPA